MLLPCRLSILQFGSLSLSPFCFTTHLSPFEPTVANEGIPVSPSTDLDGRADLAEVYLYGDVVFLYISYRNPSPNQSDPSEWFLPNLPPRIVVPGGRFRTPPARPRRQERAGVGTGAARVHQGIEFDRPKPQFRMLYPYKPAGGANGLSVSEMRRASPLPTEEEQSIQAHVAAFAYEDFLGVHRWFTTHQVIQSFGTCYETRCTDNCRILG